MGLNKYYFTLGQNHVHRINGHTIDCDCVPVVYAATYGKARDLFFEWTDGKFHQQYDNVDKVHLEYYPRGLVELNSPNNQRD